MNFADCQCEKCMKKIPREGFYHAPAAMHHAAQGLQSELDYWMESRVGFDPKKGNPAMDNQIERIRTAASLKAFLAKTRAKYPRAFGHRQREFEADHKPLEFVSSDPAVLREMRQKLEAKVSDVVGIPDAAHGKEQG